MDIDIDSAIAAVKKKATLWKWVICLGLVLVVGPIAWLLAQAVLGIAALGFVTALTAGMILVGVNVAPAFMDRMANMKINLIVAEATRSPLPTIRRGIDEDKKHRNEDSDSITEYDKRILAIEQQFRKLTEDLSPADVLDFQSTLNEMKQDRDGMQGDLAELDKLIDAEEREFRRMSAWWELNGAIIDAKSKVDQRRAGEAIRKIRDDAAFAAVNNQLAEARSKLRERVRNRKDVSVGAAPALSHNPSPVLVERVDTLTKVAR